MQEYTTFLKLKRSITVEAEDLTQGQLVIHRGSDGKFHYAITKLGHKVTLQKEDFDWAYLDKDTYEFVNEFGLTESQFFQISMQFIRSQCIENTNTKPVEYFYMKLASLFTNLQQLPLNLADAIEQHKQIPKLRIYQVDFWLHDMRANDNAKHSPFSVAIAVHNQINAVNLAIEVAVKHMDNADPFMQLHNDHELIDITDSAYEGLELNKEIIDGTFT